MATKTFKIGLSNTDKQNMAQEVYERLLALTFPEYDTATSYDVGDFVVYNDQLYKCIGATSGAWDSSKWQLATLNDLLTDIEDAVAFVNGKANVDGNYPTMTVGVADQLSPYDDESGDDQDEPFSFQATGTGNGTQPDFSTGSIALMKEKRGNTVVVNQQAKDLTGSNWDLSQATGSFSDGVATFTANQQYGVLSSTAAKTIVGHKYLFYLQIKPTTDLSSNQVSFVANNGATEIGNSNKTASAGVWNTWISLVDTNIEATRNYSILFIYDNRASGWDAIQVKQPTVIDLTQMFNGDIPQDLLDNPENFFRYYQGSLAYNEGTLVNANSRYLKAIGRNQWDEETVVSGSNLITKNLIKVIPNTKYFIKVPYSLGSYGCTVYEYDSSDNLINTTVQWSNVYTTSSNATGIKIEFYSGYGTTYNHDITISIYYDDESGYDQYYPYEVLTNNDTGTEVLRSADSVKDIKLPDGTIKRNVGTYIFTGNETVSYSSEYDFFTVACDINGVAFTTKVIISGYEPVVSIDDDRWTQIDGNGTGIRLANHSLNGDTNALLTSLIGKSFNYELAEPTTEQGTSFSENLVIDDFGSMDFQGTNGVPQGNLIFYPVDYKAFIDTLYDYTDGTPSNLAKKTDISSFFANITGYDATKTQTLKNVNGTLTWVDDE